MIGDLFNRHYSTHRNMLLFMMALLIVMLYDRSVLEKIPQDFFNSDALIAYDFINSIESVKSVSLWSLPPSTSFFPDFIIHFIVQNIVQSPTYTLVFFSIAQIFLILFTFFYLNSVLFRESGLTKQANVIVLLSFVFILFAIRSGRDHSNLQPMLIYGHHGGILPSLLLSLAFILEDQKVRKNIFLFFIIAVTVASDKIFILQFSIPAALLLYFLAISKWSKFKLFAIITIGSIAGIKLESVLRNKLKYLSHDLFSQVGTDFLDSFPISLFSIEKWKEVFSVFGSELTLFSLLALFFGIFILPLLYLSLIAKNKISYALLFVFIVTAVNVSALLLTKYSFDFFAVRYLLPAIILPVIVFFFLLLIKKNRILIRLCTLAAMLVAAIYGYNEGVSSPDLFSRVKDFRSVSAACADIFYSEYHLKKGISGYWTARPATIYSERDIFIYPVDETLNPGLRNTNLEDITSKTVSPPEFFIPEGNLKEKAKASFGLPIQIFKCNSVEFWIYGKKHPAMIRYAEEMKVKLLLWEKMTGRD